ncbi:Macrolide export ATP-binding/permease protein MacB [Luteitalea pratensis]|uniref:Macrolide export ATP-binding/permease protein MacB n=1 Tax=Luteitalea pratensis TaxID=1855912 RepID=A0A143PF55_LUTPR|nr:ADOP family duplicated permease [Luteitalea pratensis]AMY07066.1 Macrolide export ATP-binding/permease protein MacB [Luteitalea pratensis]
MNALLSRIRHLLHRSRLDADLREEIETHRTLRQEALERDGIPSHTAHDMSRRALGNVSLAIEEARDVWVVRVWEALRQDVHTAVRGLRRSPGFAAVAIGTLALGIGANTALFSIFSSLLLRPLPVRAPEQLVLLADGSWTFPIWEEIRRLDGDLADGAIAWSNESFDTSERGETAPLDGAYVNGRYFDVLGVSPVRGRMLAADDDTGAAADGMVAVISHSLWVDRFGAGDDVIGQRLTLERVPFTIVGVMPPEFAGTEVGRRMDVAVPFASEPTITRGESSLRARSDWWVQIMLRLKPGQHLSQANAALRAVQPHIRQATLPEWPEAMLAKYLTEPFELVSAETGRSTLRDRFATPLTAMLVAVCLVLLVACANIAGVLLARAVSRQRELSVRLALGASRWRVARLLFTESAIVAAAGAALGLVIAQWAGAVLVAQLATWRETVVLPLTLDWRVLLFAAGVACTAAIVAGSAPVLGVKSVAPSAGLRAGGRGVAGDRRFAIRGALVVTQIALSLLLVAAAGLFLRTFASLHRVPLGFEPESVLVAQLNLQRSEARADARGARVEYLLQAIAGTPGITSMAASLKTPMGGSSWNNWVGSSPTPPASRRLMTWLNATTPGWFEAMGIERIAGRDFDADDRAGAPKVAIVNESFAERFLGGTSPIGQVMRLGSRDGGTPYEVVGLVRDTLYQSPREGRVPTAYLSIAQQPQITATIGLTLRTSPAQRGAVQRAVAERLAQADPLVAVTFRAFDQLQAATIAQERLVALLSGFFGALALLLAAIGVYGIVSHAVRARQSEIGVRVALGAGPGRIVGLILRSVMVLVAVGVAVGLAGALWASRFVATMLFQLQPHDAATFIGSAATLTAVALIAAWIPAWRAARVAPASVLRDS